MQVVLRGPGADEQPGTDFGVRVPLGRQPCDLRFLHGEDVARLHGASAHGLAGRLEFSAGPLGERGGPESAEHVVGGPEVLARFGSPLLAA